MRCGFDELTVTYGHHHAVAGITLDVADGAVTALVGGDGAGKTTLLRALSGRVPATAGRVRRPPLARVGVLTADPPGYADLTVDENLRFVGRVRGMGAGTLDARAATLLDATGLAAARSRLAAHLSGGMRRKLGFALAGLHDPDVLLLDEPTTGVDPVSRTELWRLMAGAAGAGTTVVFATTYLDEAERCAQVLALDRGRTLAQGPPDEVAAALRGRLFRAPARGPDGRSWRRGHDWRVWAPDAVVNAARGGLVPVEPDLEDAVVVAMLRRAAHDGPEVR